MIDWNVSPSRLLGLIEFFLGLVFFYFFRLVLLQVITVVLKLGRDSTSALDICNKSVSACFSVLTVSVGASVFNTCGDNVITEKNSFLRHYIYFAVSYFFHDLYSMYRVIQSESGNVPISMKYFFGQRPLMVAHHLGIGILSLPILLNFERRFGDCLLSCAFFMEFSTPFVSLRAILAVLGYKKTKLYVMNGLVMVLSFFACRILIFPYIYSLYAQQIGKPILTTVIHHVPVLCNMGTAIAFVPQVYWLFVMLKGSIKVFNSVMMHNGSDKQK